MFLDVGNKYLDPSFQQIKAEEKENQQEQNGPKITLDKKEVAKKETKKKGGFC